MFETITIHKLAGRGKLRVLVGYGWKGWGQLKKCRKRVMVFRYKTIPFYVRKTAQITVIVVDCHLLLTKLAISEIALVQGGKKMEQTVNGIRKKAK